MQEMLVLLRLRDAFVDLWLSPVVVLQALEIIEFPVKERFGWDL